MISNYLNIVGSSKLYFEKSLELISSVLYNINGYSKLNNNEILIHRCQSLKQNVILFPSEYTLLLKSEILWNEIFSNFDKNKNNLWNIYCKDKWGSIDDDYSAFLIIKSIKE